MTTPPPELDELDELDAAQLRALLLDQLHEASEILRALVETVLPEYRHRLGSDDLDAVELAYHVTDRSAAAWADLTVARGALDHRARPDARSRAALVDYTAPTTATPGAPS